MGEDEAEWSQEESLGREESTEGSIHKEEEEQAGQMEDVEDAIAVLDQAVIYEEDDDDDEEGKEMVTQNSSTYEFIQ